MPLVNPSTGGGAAGRWQKIATATASSSATVDFTGLSSSYIAYKIMLSHVAPATDNVTLYLRTSANNGSSYDSGASNYSYLRNVWVNGTASQVGSTGATEIQLLNAMGNAANELISGEITIFNPAATQYAHIGAVLNGTGTSSEPRSAVIQGRRLTAAAINAVQLLFSSGNIASGQFDLFGMAS